MKYTLSLLAQHTNLDFIAFDCKSLSKKHHIINLYS